MRGLLVSSHDTLVPLIRGRWWLSGLAKQPLSRGMKTLEPGSSAKVTQKGIRALLDSNKCTYTVGHASFVLHCPLCDKPRAAANGKSVFVNKTTGSVVCKPCGMIGSWSDFCQWMKTSRTKSQPFVPPTRVSEANSGLRSVQDLWTATQPLGKASNELIDQVNRAFGIQHLKPASLDKYCIHTVLAKFPMQSGKVSQVPCVVFPWFDSDSFTKDGLKDAGRVIRVKLETLTADKQVTLEPIEGPYGLFGWNTVPKNAKELVITAGEFDAIAVSQLAKLPAVALPNGTSVLPPEVLPQLEQFEKIYLWLGTDVQSRQAASKFAKKLDVDRCFLVCSNDNCSFSTALDALNKGHDLRKILGTAKPFTHKQILSFRQLRNEVLNELTNASQVAGVKWKRFPNLTSVLKGHRPGELTIFTGPTGSGKTTLMSELSLDLCQQGVSTLWGSFEIRNVRLVKSMLKQFSGLNLEHHVKQFDYWADRFQQLPMYFMGFYGSVDIETVIETMSHATYVYDIQHVIVDNLQFMTGTAFNIGDRYALQNAVVAEFRKFASEKNVHVSLVIHPRKEDESAELTTASIFGTAKATQEADNVLILQSSVGNSRQKCLQVTKNRFDGDLGRIPLKFNRESLTLSGCKNDDQQKLSSTPTRVHPSEKSWRKNNNAASTVYSNVTTGTVLDHSKPGRVLQKAASYHQPNYTFSSKTRVRLGTKLSEQASPRPTETAKFRNY